MQNGLVAAVYTDACMLKCPCSHLNSEHRSLHPESRSSLALSGRHLLRGGSRPWPQNHPPASCPRPGAGMWCTRRRQASSVACPPGGKTTQDKGPEPRLGMQAQAGSDTGHGVSHAGAHTDRTHLGAKGSRAELCITHGLPSSNLPASRCRVPRPLPTCCPLGTAQSMATILQHPEGLSNILRFGTGFLGDSWRPKGNTAHGEGQCLGSCWNSLMANGTTENKQQTDQRCPEVHCSGGRPGDTLREVPSRRGPFPWTEGNQVQGGTPEPRSSHRPEGRSLAGEGVPPASENQTWPQAQRRAPLGAGQQP